MPLASTDAPRSRLATVLFAGTVVGALDAIFIVVTYVVLGRATLLRLFQGIAGSLLDKATYEGGVATALLGLLLHFGVAHGWAAVWLIADERSATLRRWTGSPAGVALVGALYGAAIFFAMRWLVLPLTHAGSPVWGSFHFNLQLAAHAVLIGPPLVAIVRLQSPSHNPSRRQTATAEREAVPPRLER